MFTKNIHLVQILELQIEIATWNEKMIYKKFVLIYNNSYRITRFGVPIFFCHHSIVIILQVVYIKSLHSRLKVRLSNENEIGAFPLLWENMYLEILKERLFFITIIQNDKSISMGIGVSVFEFFITKKLFSYETCGC